MDNSNAFQLISLVFGSNIVLEIVKNLFQKKRAATEQESLVIKNYQTIVADIRLELDRLQKKVSSIEEKELEYIKNSNYLLEQNALLSARVSSLEQENTQLKKQLNSSTPKL